MGGYLTNHQKSRCTACETCAAVCPVSAIGFAEDDEGFRYPTVDEGACVHCGTCVRACPMEKGVPKNAGAPLVFGGYNRDDEVRDKSTSGGVFAALAEVWCDEDCAIFGAEAKGLEIRHSCITDKRELGKFQKSKYSQSTGGKQAFQKAKEHLLAGKRVLYSGTPCQIAGLMKYIGTDCPTEKLLTVEVVCEGFPSPILMRKYVEELEEKRGSKVTALDYRYKDKDKWDFQVMKIDFADGRSKKVDRWFSPFWIFWLKGLMSRPSCADCEFRTPDRTADITLGDLWGVQKYCPELYGENKGCSLVVASSPKGKKVLQETKKYLFGHDLRYEDALRYQSPMRSSAPANPKRDEFMEDLKKLSYSELCKKWRPRYSLKLLISKYVWGSNRQIVFLWKIKRKIFGNLGRAHLN